MPEPFAIYDRRSTSVPVLVGYVDGYLTEEHERQVEVTRFPVESGASLSDHAVEQPASLKLSGWASDQFPADPVHIPETDRPAQAWARLGELMAERQPLEVVTVLGVYADMVIVRAVAPVTERTGRGLIFTLELQQVRTVPLRQIEFVIRPTPTGPAADRVNELEDDFVQGGEVHIGGPTTFSAPVDEVLEEDPFAFLGDLGDVVGSAIQNVAAAGQQGDLGGAVAAAVAGGQGAGEIIGGLIGDKIADLQAQFGAEDPDALADG